MSGVSSGCGADSGHWGTLEFSYRSRDMEMGIWVENGEFLPKNGWGEGGCWK